MSDEIEVGLEGSPPAMSVGQGNPEALKYGKVWARDEYRVVAPGEQLAQLFLQQARPRPGSHVIDFGCGTGRGALQIAVFGGCRVTMVDFVNNSLDPDIREMLTTQAHALRFVKADLERGPLPNAEYGFCTDVMEHIPPDKVELVLNNILCAAQHVFFSISTVPDHLGALIGEPLHLSVHPYAWWLEEFKRRDCVVHWSENLGSSCVFYVTGWITGRKLVESDFPINTTEETVREQVRQNLAAGWLQIMPQETNDVDMAILGGGPSLNLHEDEIKQLRADGVKVATLNGAYNWALAHGITPHVTIMVDARAFNARFVEPVVEDTRYLLSSQCHPDVFKNLPRERTFIWHSDTELIKDILDAHYEHWWTVPGGSTVLFRSIPLLRMLGYRRFHLFGCDSCLTDDEHHAYSQPENDGAPIVPVVVNAKGQLIPNQVDGGRVFYCNPWMIVQAQEMCELVRFMGDEIELEIHGDGLLAHILKVGAAIEEVSA